MKQRDYKTADAPKTEPLKVSLSEKLRAAWANKQLLHSADNVYPEAAQPPADPPDGDDRRDRRNAAYQRLADGITKVNAVIAEVNAALKTGAEQVAVYERSGTVTPGHISYIGPIPADYEPIEGGSTASGSTKASDLAALLDAALKEQTP